MAHKCSYRAGAAGRSADGEPYMAVTLGKAAVEVQ
jgi:ribosome modulation factor